MLPIFFIFKKSMRFLSNANRCLHSTPLCWEDLLYPLVTRGLWQRRRHMAMGPCAASWESLGYLGLLGCLSRWAGCLFFFFKKANKSMDACTYCSELQTLKLVPVWNLYTWHDEKCCAWSLLSVCTERDRNENLFVLQMQHSSIISAYHYHLISCGHIISDW